MHAVSALVWGDWPDYPPAVDVVLDLLGRCDVPQDWRTILLISCGALEPRDSPLVLSRKAEGHFTVPVVPAIGVATRSQNELPDHGGRSYLIVRNALRTTRLETTTSITVLNPTDSVRAAGMALQWWGTSPDDDASGSAPFERDGTYDDAVTATVAVGAEYRLVCVVADQ